MAHYYRQKNSSYRGKKVNFYLIASCEAFFQHVANLILNRFDVYVVSDLDRPKWKECYHNTVVVLCLDDIIVDMLPQFEKRLREIHEYSAIWCYSLGKKNTAIFDEFVGKMGWSADTYYEFPNFIKPVKMSEFNKIDAKISHFKHDGRYSETPDKTFSYEMAKHYLSYFSQKYQENPTDKYEITYINKTLTYIDRCKEIGERIETSIYQNCYDVWHKTIWTYKGKESHEKYSDLCYAYAKRLYEKKKYQEALPIFEEAKDHMILSGSSKYEILKASYYYYMGMCLYRMKDYKLAMAHLDYAKSNASYKQHGLEYLTACRFYGMAASQEGQENLKVKAYQHIVDILKDVPISNLKRDEKEIYNHVCCYMVTHYKNEGNIQKKEEFNRLFVETYTGIKTYAKMYIRLIKSYIEEYKKENNTEKVYDYYNRLADAYRYDDSLKATQRQLLEVQIYYDLGEMSRKVGNVDKAIEAYENYTSYIYSYIHPRSCNDMKALKDYSYVNYQLGCMYEKKGNKSKALDAFMIDYNNALRIIAANPIEYEFKEIICTCNKIEELSLDLKKYELHYLFVYEHARHLQSLVDLGSNEYSQIDVPDYYNNAGLTLSSKEKYDIALLLHQKVFNLNKEMYLKEKTDQNNLRMLKALAEISYCNGNKDEALQQAHIYQEGILERYKDNPTVDNQLELSHAYLFAARREHTMKNYSNAMELMHKCMKVRCDLEGKLGKEDYDFYQALAHDWCSFFYMQAGNQIDIYRVSKHGLKYCENYKNNERFSEVYNSLKVRNDNARRRIGFSLFNKDEDLRYIAPYVLYHHPSATTLSFEIQHPEKLLASIDQVRYSNIYDLVKEKYSA